MTLATLVHWTGTAVIGLLCIGGLLLVLYLVLGVLGQAVWRRLTRCYDLYVVEYWIKLANRNGFQVPTRASVERQLREIREASE